MNLIVNSQARTLAESITPKIIARAKVGDEDALSVIYNRYRLDIYRYLYYRVGELKTAEDLTSDVFERMIRAIRRSSFQNISLESWLFQIARNLAIDHYRKTNLRDQETGDIKIDQIFENQLVTDPLVQALKEVNDIQRDVIILRFAVNMPIAQVAQTLHRSEDSVKGLQRRGLMTIRNILSEWEGSDA